MSDDIVAKLFDGFLTPVQQVAEETLAAFGPERVCYFTEVANDWIDLQKAILQEYSHKEVTESLVCCKFAGLFKEVVWFQFHFLAGNYPVLNRGLRFVWEMLYRAYYVDTYATEHWGTLPAPGPSLYDKVEWLRQHERGFRWGTVIQPILERLLPTSERPRIATQFAPLWQRLNEHAHPSVAYLEQAMGETAAFVRDAFDPNWSAETLQRAEQAFDLLWLVVVSRFPRCAETARSHDGHLRFPLTCGVYGGTPRVTVPPAGPTRP